jgi:hypothetical protein
MLVSAGPISIEKLLESLVAELDCFSQGVPSSDDVTALVMRFLG